MKLKHVDRITRIALAVIVLLCFLAEYFSLPLLAGFALLLLIGALLFHFCLYRCPYCGRSLRRRRWWNDEYCPRCGKKVTQDDEI